MAPTNFKLTLTLKDINESPQDMQTHINEAIAAAKRLGIKGRGGQVDPNAHDHRIPQDNGHNNGQIVWRLNGVKDPTGKNLAARWGGAADTVDPINFPAFNKDATVTVAGPDDDP
jgi:hypothetical protein